MSLEFTVKVEKPGGFLYKIIVVTEVVIFKNLHSELMNFLDRNSLEL
jgi:hypothetical protein